MSEAETRLSSEPVLFVLSFRQRDELATLAARAGWRVVAARRAEGTEWRLRTSGAGVAVVDARGAVEDGLAGIRLLAPVAEAQGAAVLALVSRNEAERLGDFFAAGATHFLLSPAREGELVQALRFAARHSERVAGWHERPGTSEPLGWRYDPALGSLQLTPALAALLGIAETPSVRMLLGRIGAAERENLRAALLRLGEQQMATAFAHELPGVGRVVEHLQFDPRTRRLHGLVEPLGPVPDATAAVRDALTGVHDAPSARRWLERRLGHGHRLSVMLVALTRLDTVNTAYGREAGDSVLRAVSRRIGEAARDTLGHGVFVARLGGSEFLVAAENEEEPRMAALRTRIEEALDRPVVSGETIAPLGARIAWVASEAGDSVTALLGRASMTLHDPFGGNGDGAGMSPLALVDDLRRALDLGEIAVRFQPQVAIATGAIVGVEALARWNHPVQGEIGAETLFATAERAGLELALSAQVQRLALDTAAHWPSALRDLRLSINITAAEVARPGFADTLLGRIDASGFPRRRLTVEITESGLIADLGEAARLLSELRTAGCRVAIDDFGTGYSSLAYLKALPLDYLKIDKKLSQDITGTPRDRVVVRGVIDMSRSLGLSVVAEGVETDEQLELLAKEGCQYYQGFLCAEPLDTEGLIALAG